VMAKHPRKQIDIADDTSFWDVRLAVDTLDAPKTIFGFQVREPDRAKLAERLKISGFHKIAGEIAISILADKCWQVDFSVGFDVVQPCVVSFKDVSEYVEFAEQERYIETLVDAEELSGEYLDLEALDRGHIPVGEAIAQLIAVHISAFPRSDEADRVMEEKATTGKISPFHKLSELKKPQ